MRLNSYSNYRSFCSNLLLVPHRSCWSGTSLWIHKLLSTELSHWVEFPKSAEMKPSGGLCPYGGFSKIGHASMVLWDQKWRKATRTTNAIERRFREVRRRTRPMGVFYYRTSVARILYAVFTYENKQQGIATPFLLTQNSWRYHHTDAVNYHILG